MHRSLQFSPRKDLCFSSSLYLLSSQKEKLLPQQSLVQNRGFKYSKASKIRFYRWCLTSLKSLKPSLSDDRFVIECCLIAKISIHSYLIYETKNIFICISGQTRQSGSIFYLYRHVVKILCKTQK